MHATRVGLSSRAGAATRATRALRVAVWSAHPIAAEALRDLLRRAPVGFDAERLVDDDSATVRFDVGLVLHDELAASALRLLRAGVPVLQLADSGGTARPGVRVLPRDAALPAIVRAIELLAHPLVPGGAPRASLSAREMEVATRYAQGQPILVIASELDIGLESVRTYLRRARTKLRGDGHDASSQARLAELHAYGMLRQRPRREHAAAP